MAYESPLQGAGDIREQEVRDRSRAIETATLPVEELKNEVNNSMEAFADKLLQLEGEVEELKKPDRNGVLSDNELLKVVGFILSNEKLVQFLVDKLKDKLKAERIPVKVSFEI